MKEIPFPTDPQLNSTGQFNKLHKTGSNDAGFKFFLHNTTTKQSKELAGSDLRAALRVVVDAI